MSGYQKELMAEIVEEWDVAQLDVYLTLLKTRKDQLDDWMRIVQNIRRNKVTKERKKKPLDNGTRGGNG